MIGALETGGTTCRCAIAADPQTIVAEHHIPTTDPVNTLAEVVHFFASQPPIEALGIAAFGPLDLNSSSPAFGTVTQTPKQPWQQFGLLNYLQDALEIPCDITTDVEAAANAELQFGAAQDVDSVLYATIGTGVGAALAVRGQRVPQLMHTEMGHIHVARHPQDAYPGDCPFHGDCLEGMVAAPAIRGRRHAEAASLDETDPTWDVIAYYLGQFVVAAIRMLAPERLLLGGGIMTRPSLLPEVLKESAQMLGGYHEPPDTALDHLVQQPQIQQPSLLGALLAADRLRR